MDLVNEYHFAVSQAELVLGIDEDKPLRGSHL